MTVWHAGGTVAGLLSWLVQGTATAAATALIFSLALALDLVRRRLGGGAQRG